MEVGQASSPLEPQEVSKEFVEHDDSDFSDGDEFIVDPNSPTRTKWVSKTLHVAGELPGDPNGPRRTRSQFESGMCMKDPMFAENCYLIVDYNPQTYEEATGDPRWKKSMKEDLSSLQKSNTWELVDLPPGRKLV